MAWRAAVLDGRPTIAQDLREQMSTKPEALLPGLAASGREAQRLDGDPIRESFYTVHIQCVARWPPQAGAPRAPPPRITTFAAEWRIPGCNAPPLAA